MTLHQWPLGLFDCFNYTDFDGKRHICPDFCPAAVLGGCCMAGEISTIMNQEKPICLRMGPIGIATCIISLPITIFGPFGGIFYGMVCGIRDRLEMVRMYDIDDSKTCEVGGSRCLLCIALLYPCNTFQMIMTLRDFERRGIKPAMASNLKTQLI